MCERLNFLAAIRSNNLSKADAALKEELKRPAEQQKGAAKLQKLRANAVPQDLSGCWKSIAEVAAALVHMGKELAVEIVQEFVESAALNTSADGKTLEWEANIIVNTTENRGKGSPNYVDDARLFKPQHIKEIDAFIDKCHADGKDGGGTVSVMSISTHLEEKFPALSFSNSAVLYALRKFCNSGEGYKWGKVKPRKCQSDPTRMEVKRSYLRDFGDALIMEDRGDYAIVYIDGVLMPVYLLMCVSHPCVSHPESSAPVR